MQATTYNVVRVNTEDHNSYKKAMSDMAFIINEGLFWKKSSRLYLPIGSLLMAAGTNHGRGLYLIGIVTGEWQDTRAYGSYRNIIPVQWQSAIYRLPANSVEHIASLLPRWNDHSGSRDVLPGEFSLALSYVMQNATVLAPDYHWQSEAA
jgi:hypothetical protein